VAAQQVQEAAVEEKEREANQKEAAERVEKDMRDLMRDLDRSRSERKNLDFEAWEKFTRTV
jgi:hypothetical protein